MHIVMILMLIAIVLVIMDDTLGLAGADDAEGEVDEVGAAVGRGELRVRRRLGGARVRGIRRQGMGSETQELLTEGAYALLSYALTSCSSDSSSPWVTLLV